MYVPVIRGRRPPVFYRSNPEKIRYVSSIFAFPWFVSCYPVVHLHGGETGIVYVDYDFEYYSSIRPDIDQIHTVDSYSLSLSPIVINLVVQGFLSNV